MPRKLAVFFHLVLLLLLVVGAADSMTQKVLGAGKMVMRSKAGNAGVEIVGKMFKDLAKKAKASVNKLINKTELDAHKAAKNSAAQKNLDQLVYDYGMENEYAAIDMNRPVPFNGMGSYGSGAGYAGEWPFATEEFVGRDYYGAPGAFAAAPAFIW